LKNGNACIGASVHLAGRPRGSPICFYPLTSGHRSFFLKKNSPQRREPATALSHTSCPPSPPCPARLFSTVPPSPARPPARLPLHRATLSTRATCYGLLHRSGELSATKRLLQDGVARSCPLLVVQPLPLFHVAEPPPLARRLQAPLCHCLRHADEPPFSQVARRCCAESTYCKCMF
jgi:hypothetical protein